MQVAGTDNASRGDELGLIGAMLEEACADAGMAARVITAARDLGVDPIDYCSRRYGLGDDVVLKRAAHWAGFGFSPAIPRIADPPPIRRLDLLADVCTIRGRIGGRDITFYAPDFDRLLHLKSARAGNPELARHLCIVPARVLRAEMARSSTESLLTEARHRLTRRWRNASANVDLPVHVRIVFVALLLVVTATIAVAPYFFSAWMLPLVAALILVPAVIRLAATLAYRPPPKPPPLLSDADLPTYTVLIPLRDEASMVPMLRLGMEALDYPPEKLDIKFVVEQKSTETIAAVRRIMHDPRFELVLIPDAGPYTKPKALNFAMPLARGQHLVVFDAEDIPDRGQLRLAASHFAADPGLDCIQAELVIENAGENWITALFAAEYAGQFGLMLPLLGRFHLPMPLGGTSNHFQTAALRELGHWDAYNVTEDADLGVRLSRLRYRSDTFVSETLEEAPISMDAWMVQRTRWIKGWMQTFIVHNRRVGDFLRDIGWRNFLFFEIYVGSLILSSLLHTVFVVSLLVRGLLGHWPRLDDAVDAIYLTVLVIGYGATAVLFLGGIVRRRAWSLLPYQILQPVYWMLHSVAALRAAHQLMFRPYFWGKTAHGRTRARRRIETAPTSRSATATDRKPRSRAGGRR